jgi:hypothetical protein
MSATDNNTSTPVIDTPNKGLNPIVAIGVAIIIALVLAGTSLYIFLNSDTREIIDIKEESISANDTDLSETPVETSELSTTDLNIIESGIKSTANGIDSDDFSSSEITDAALGL